MRRSFPPQPSPSANKTWQAISTLRKIDIVIKTYVSHLGRLLVLLGFCLLTANSQQDTQPATRIDYSAAFAIGASASRRTISEPAPALRPAPKLIIDNLIAVETKFREALTQFSFKRDVVLETIGAHGEVTGQYLRNSVFVIDDRGERIEQVLYHPQPSIKAMKITKEDIQDLAGSQLFGLEAADLNAYDLAYQGTESVKGQAAYLVRVTPKAQPDPNNMRVRFFVGLIWIDQATFQILQLRGTTEPHGKQRFPLFQTTRDLQVENLRFPSATSADDVLHFPHRDVHYRISVRYYDFKRFASRLKIVEIDN